MYLPATITSGFLRFILSDTRPKTIDLCFDITDNVSVLVSCQFTEIKAFLIALTVRTLSRPLPTVASIKCQLHYEETNS